MLEQTIRSDYDENIKEQVTNAISLIDSIYKKYQVGEYSLEQAKTLAADIVRELRYKEGAYFWIDTYNVVLLGKDVEGTNRLDTTDANGFEMVSATTQQLA
ncbi:MAG: cache domain-containing protein [Velocimicrobium sp.]